MSFVTVSSMNLFHNIILYGLAWKRPHCSTDIAMVTHFVPANISTHGQEFTINITMDQSCGHQ